MSKVGALVELRPMEARRAGLPVKKFDGTIYAVPADALNNETMKAEVGNRDEKKGA
jgi:hypothetical protein